MTIVFFGSGEFALPSLRRVAADRRFSIVRVITQPDRPAGRMHQPQPTPVKQLARQLNLPVAVDLSQATAVAADVGIVIDYGRIIPAKVRQHFPCGIVNVHPSLLPAYRGPAPIQHALLNGASSTGVSIIRIDQGVDTGPWLAQTVVPIQPTDTAVTLERTLAAVGAELLIATLPPYLQGALTARTQPNTGVSYAPKLTRHYGECSPTEAAQQIWRKFRALHPWPGVWFTAQGQRFKIVAMELHQQQPVITAIQPAGKRILTLAEFQRGYPAILFANMV